MSQKKPKHILPVIVFAQFSGTSLWFAGNAVIESLIEKLDLAEYFLGYVTMSVQAGFILGTLIFALLNVADRFSPVRVFLISCLCGAFFNVLTIWAYSPLSVLLLRLATGVFLAGVYPVGMKIATDWHKEGLGKAMGFLVGALVLGTAFPHLLRFLGGNYPWKFVFIATSILASFGGFLLFLTVEDGPYKKQSSHLKFNLLTTLKLFKNKNFKSAAFGYFGHMWELYTFWTFVPIILSHYFKMNSHDLSVSLWSFFIISMGSLSCVVGGYISLKKGSRWVSMMALTGSGISCVLIGLGFPLPLSVFLIIMSAWAIFVVPDSPQLSTLVAQSSPSSFVATGLTIVNSLGFALTILSIELTSYLWSLHSSYYVFLIVAFGPVMGLVFTKKINV